MTGVVACGAVVAEAAIASGPRTMPRAAIRPTPSRIGIRLPAFSSEGPSRDDLNMQLFLHDRDGAEKHSSSTHFLGLRLVAVALGQMRSTTTLLLYSSFTKLANQFRNTLD